MRRGLLSLLIFLCVCSTAYSQVDSGNQATPPVAAAPDSNKLIATDTHQVVAMPAIISDPVSKPDIVAGPATDVQKAYPVYWLAVAGLLGLLAGGFGYKLLFRKDVDQVIDPMSSTAAQATEEPENQLNLEKEHEELHAENTRLMVENEQLKRANAEQEQLLHTANNESEMSDNEKAKEMIFYMPQPNMNGRFQEASRRADAANALYAFRAQPDRPDTASFEFIAKDAYLNAAIGNEPTWIAIACDRTNQPSASTTRVKTVAPGMAQLKDGEWEITRKAKITYL